MKASEQDNTDAQYEVGRCYDYGNGTEEDPVKAFEWYLKAAEQGYEKAQYEVGLCYACGYGTEEDPVKAFEWYLKASEQDNTDAQYEVGKCYEKGYGIEKNPKKAFEWYMKAAEQDNDKAQYKIGVCYEIGYFAETPIDLELGKTNIEIAGTPVDLESAYKWYLKAAENGNGQAMCYVGRCFFYKIGVKQDFNESVKWYNMAVENGYDAANLFLGICYEYGAGVKSNYNTAIQYYKKTEGCAELVRLACYRIAELYCTDFKNGRFNIAPISAGALTLGIIVPLTNFVTLPVVAAGTVASAIIKDKVYLKSEKGQEMIKYYQKAAELGHEEAKKKYEKYKKYLKQG